MKVTRSTVRPRADGAANAGVPVFAVSRFIGSSIAMIDHHYGHLAHDSRHHAVSLLDALAYEQTVDATWTSPPPSAKPFTFGDSLHHGVPPLRAVDATWTPHPHTNASESDETAGIAARS